MIAVREGIADVQIAAASACGACRAKSVCGTGSSKIIHVQVAAHTVPGARLSIEMAETDINLAVVIGYLLPAVTLLCGALLLSPLGDTFAALGSILGLVTGLLLMQRVQQTRFADRFIPTVTTCASGPDICAPQPSIHSSHSFTGEAP